MGPLSIEQLKTSLDRGGFQRSHLYDVFIAKGFGDHMFNQALDAAGFDPNTFLFDNELSVRTKTVALPTQTIATNPIKVNGMDYEHPYQMNYEGDISFTFILDEGSKLRDVFVNWMNNIYSSRGKYAYRPQYATKIQIRMLNSIGQPNAAYNIEEAFPKTISQTELNGETPGLSDFTVTFSYRYFNKTNEL